MDNNLENAQNLENVQNVVESEADKIFIPSDIEGSRIDYTEYKSGFIRTVPENCYLVRVNRFTGKITNKGGRGLKFMLPFVSKSILIPVIDRTIDYKKIEYRTADDTMVNIDIALNVRITDPVKYMTVGKYQLDQLSTLTHSLLRRFVQGLEFDQISSGTCSLSAFSPARFDSVTGDQLPSAYEEFEQLYGIKINRVDLKEVRRPENIEKLADDRVEAQKQFEADEVRRKNKRADSELQREIYMMQEDAKNKTLLDKWGKLFEELDRRGLSLESIVKLLETETLAQSPNTRVILGGDSQKSGSIARGIAAGIDNVTANMGAASPNRGNFEQTMRPVKTSVDKTPQEPQTNSEKFLEQISIYKIFGIITEDTYNEIINNFFNKDGVKENLDNLDLMEYNKTFERLMNFYGVTSDQLSSLKIKERR